MTSSANADQSAAAESPFSRPPKKISADWSAHITTTLDRLAEVLSNLSEEQWEAESLCEGWRVRDVVGHIIWRLGESNSTMLRSSMSLGPRFGFNPNRVFDHLAREEAEASTEELITKLRVISAQKLQGHGRTGIIELTEAVVHTYDITEALGVRIRLSPRSTGAVALAHIRSIGGGRPTRIAREHSLRAVDARWIVGSGPNLDATAGQILMHLFGRRPLTQQ